MKKIIWKEDNGYMTKCETKGKIHVFTSLFWFFIGLIILFSPIFMFIKWVMIAIVWAISFFIMIDALRDIEIYHDNTMYHIYSIKVDIFLDIFFPWLV